MNGLQLFAQVVLTLILFDLIAHAIFDPAFQGRDFDLGGEVNGDMFQTTQWVRDLEERLSTRDVGQQWCREQIGEMTGVRRSMHHILDFDGSAPRASANRLARFCTWQ